MKYRWCASYEEITPFLDGWFAPPASDAEAREAFEKEYDVVFDELASRLGALYPIDVDGKGVPEGQAAAISMSRYVDLDRTIDVIARVRDPVIVRTMLALLQELPHEYRITVDATAFPDGQAYMVVFKDGTILGFADTERSRKFLLGFGFPE